MPSSTDDQSGLGLKKLGGTLLLVVGLLLLGAGIYSETFGLTVLGVLLFVAGVVLLSLKIIRRNRPA